MMTRRRSSRDAPESADSISPLSTRDSVAPDRSRSTPSVCASLSGDSPASSATTTYAVIERRRGDGKGVDPPQRELAYALEATQRRVGRQLIFSSADSLAKAPASPASEAGSPTNAPRSSGNSRGSRTKARSRGSSSRTFQACALWGSDTTSRRLLPRLRNAGQWSSGGLWTADISTWPSDANECSLSRVLIPSVPTRYFLSPKAAAGILRRAAKRKRELPEALQAALTALASAIPADATRTT